LGQLQELPTAMLDLALALVMMLDSIPIIGIAVPGDVAILTAMGVSTPIAAAGALLWVVGGCLAGLSLTFAAGRLFGERIRQGRLGTWIGEARWEAAERALSSGGRILVVAPFLPVLNTLVPLAAGGLRMPYHRFARYSALGSALWAGLYMALGLTSRQIGGLLPGQPFTLLATVAIGLAFGWITMLVTRRRLAKPEAGTATRSPATRSRGHATRNVSRNRRRTPVVTRSSTRPAARAGHGRRPATTTHAARRYASASTQA
jgi:membrane protein DedA with SNARE-associated domain